MSRPFLASPSRLPSSSTRPLLGSTAAVPPAAAVVAAEMAREARLLRRATAGLCSDNVVVQA